jgi:hypothetical protein
MLALADQGAADRLQIVDVTARSPESSNRAEPPADQKPKVSVSSESFARSIFRAFDAALRLPMFGKGRTPTITGSSRGGCLITALVTTNPSLRLTTTASIKNLLALLLHKNHCISRIRIAKISSYFIWRLIS